jgi:NTE family protein
MRFSAWITISLLVIVNCFAASSIKEQPKIALALGGGAALGYAHLGVIQVLEEAGIVPDIVLGASIGSIVGAYYCAGLEHDQIVKEAENLGIFQLLDWKIGRLGFFEWKKVRRKVDKSLGGLMIEDLNPQLICVATNLITGERVKLEKGNLIDCMLASATIPGLYQPIEIDGNILVDGGLVDEVPLLSASETDAEFIIAVDVSHPLIGEELKTPFSVIRQSYFILQMQNIERRKEHADVMIRPDLSGMDFHKFGEVNKAVARGRLAAEKMLPEILQKLAQCTLDKNAQEK